jgi:hypothetical protein
MEDSRLTITDLASLHSLLDAACSRGAFKASEMSQVGQVYDKLSAFLKSLQNEGAQPNMQPVGEKNA